ncbi:MAG: hypothetical protein JOZ58_26800 [Acetobacteraceae bacterium]|nr:hypothetical protein [Acetobacteraceae bacterium]
MLLILFQVIVQTISSTLQWFGFYAGVRSSAGSNLRPWPWVIGSAIVFAAWLAGTMILAANNFFGSDVFSFRLPAVMAITLAIGYLLLLSDSFRRIIAAIPQHWLIGIQAFRVLGGLFLVRYFQGSLPGLFAIPAGLGDLLTGILAPLVAYWWYTGKPFARNAAIAWNLLGIADLVNAIVMRSLSNADGLVFPIVMIPVYAVPRALLIHSYSLIGLFGKTSRAPEPGEALHHGVELAKR